MSETSRLWGVLNCSAVCQNRSVGRLILCLNWKPCFVWKTSQKAQFLQTPMTTILLKGIKTNLCQTQHRHRQLSSLQSLSVFAITLPIHACRTKSVKNLWGGFWIIAEIMAWTSLSWSRNGWCFAPDYSNGQSLAKWWSAASVRPEIGTILNSHQPMQKAVSSQIRKEI